MLTQEASAFPVARCRVVGFGTPTQSKSSMVSLSRQSKAPNLMAAARGIVASSGVAGLYRGNLVNVLRSAPQKSLDFFAFDMFKVLFLAARC